MVKRRKPRKLPKARKIEPRTMRMANPWFAPGHPESTGNRRTIEVSLNINESAVETLHARGLLTRAEKMAADAFRERWEVYGTGLRAIDYSREHVDGGSTRAPVTEAQLAARLQLQKARALLGARGFDLVREVCGKGKALKEIAADDRDRRTAADNLRTHLGDLARLWGILAVGKAKRS